MQQALSSLKRQYACALLGRRAVSVGLCRPFATSKGGGSKRPEQPEEKATGRKKPQEVQLEMATDVHKIAMDVITPHEVPDTRTPQQRKEEYDQLMAFQSHRMDKLRKWQGAIMNRIKAKQAAIQALPVDLREHALVEDTTPIPLIEWPTWTPPKPSFTPPRKAI